MAEESLKNKTVKGVAWSSIDNIARFGVTFVVSIVLARLLTPDDYGLIGIITIFTGVSSVIINGGFTTALIRKNDTTDDDYNTSFIVNFTLSILLYLIIFFGAPLIATFFNRNELVALTRTASLGIIIGAFALVQSTKLTKKIDFKTQAKITFITSVFSGFVGIIMALVGFGVWALIGQSLSSQVLGTILLFFYNKWIPKFRFSKTSFNKLFGFGWKMMASGLLDRLWREMYQVVVGKFYSPSTLGQYTRASQFSSLFSSNLTNVIQRVTFPVLSNIQDDKERMLLVYRKIIKITMFVTAISMFFLGAISEPLIYCLIGPKWIEASKYLPLICISSSMYPLHSINLNMLQVQGRSDLFLGIEIIKKVIALGPLLVGAIVGIIPMLLVDIITAVIAFYLNSYYSGRLLGYSSFMQLKDIAPSYVIAIIIAISVYFLKYIPMSLWIVLLLQGMIGISVFWFICKVFEVDEYKELWNVLQLIWRKKQNDNEQ